MMTETSIQQLFRYSRWANGLLYQALRKLEGNHDDNKDKAVRLFAHIAGSEEAWDLRLHDKEDPRRGDTWPNYTVEEAYQSLQSLADTWQSYIDDLNEGDLEKRITYVNRDGQMRTATVGDILTHMPLHGNYHRGQIATAIRLAGGTPPPSDYIRFAMGL